MSNRRKQRMSIEEVVLKSKLLELLRYKGVEDAVEQPPKDDASIFDSIDTHEDVSVWWNEQI